MQQPNIAEAIGPIPEQPTAKDISLQTRLPPLDFLLLAPPQKLRLTGTPLVAV
jgi:hypothetical protein